MNCFRVNPSRITDSRRPVSQRFRCPVLISCGRPLIACMYAVRLAVSLIPLACLRSSVLRSAGFI
jgi:hypothetical protein